VSGTGRLALHAAFFLSGAAAIIYQLIWQRVLLGLYGSSIESVTVVVTAFMVGLGVGSLAGGWIADRTELPLWRVFLMLEVAIGAFGFASVTLFRHVGEMTLTVGSGRVWLLVFLLLALPTLLMGATLPVLAAHTARMTGNVGRAVGNLYGLNTLGSAAGAVTTVLIVADTFGQQGSVQCAAALNVVAAAVVWSFRRGKAHG
jgi:predicted membrane-bound spermidine synthase